MSKNKVQDEGNLILVTAPYAVSSGGGVLVGALFGIAETDAASGGSVVIDTEGVFNITKATGASTAFAFGDRVFWDNTNKVVTPVSTGNTEVGIATADATISATTGRVRLQPLASQRLGTAQFSSFLTSGVASQSFFVAPAPIQILSVQEVHSTLGTDAGTVTGSVEKLTGTQAAGAGAAVVSTTANLKGTNNTVQSLTLSGTAANLLLDTGNRLGFVLSGTATSVAGLVVTVLFRYV